MDENLKKIKETILEIAKEMNVEIDRIVLFGSRARGDYREDSDYDLLIVTKEKLDKEREREFESRVGRKLVFGLEKPIDIIITNTLDLEKLKQSKAFIYYYSLKQGMVI